MTRPLSNFQLAAYSGISLPAAAMGMPIAVYLPRFYSEGLGLSLITVGMIFTLARIWDVITDPMMGWLIDRYETRWGRRKHWIAISVPILVIAIYHVFLPDPSSVTPLYLGFWLIVLYVGYTMLAWSSLPVSSLIAGRASTMVIPPITKISRQPNNLERSS